MLSVEDLCGEDVLFYGASLDDTYIGCVGLVLKETYGEIKSMFVDPSHRGLGLAKMLMTTLEGVAREHQLKSIKLETGELLKEAVALYRRHGFTSCDPFGDYADHPDSLFMTKNLDSPNGPLSPSSPL